jgi:Restriction endonuclease
LVNTPPAEAGKRFPPGLMPGTDNKWKRFERLVTALQRAAHENAIVTWNDSIDGRQFDVTIRFKQGFDFYLTTIECKDYAKPVPVSDVEAFVTKSRRVGANKAIMFSASGFQSGAVEVAKAENVSLYSLTSLKELSDDELAAKFVPFVCVLYFFRFRETDSRRFIAFPEEPGVLRAMMRGTTLIFPDGVEMSPEQLLEPTRPEIKNLAKAIPQTYEIELPQGTQMIDINRLNKDLVLGFLIDYVLIPIDRLKSTIGLGVDLRWSNLTGQ